jgi:hypothetical protein
MNAPYTTSNKVTKGRWLQLFPFIAFFTVLFLLTARLPFFWDKDIFFSRLAHWLIENNFSLVLPDSLDPGYPPVLGYILAITWKIFGKSLPAAHMLMLPFTFGIIWQTRILLDSFFRGKAITLSMMLILADTTFITQTVVFSTDLPMLFFMLLSLNAVNRNRRIMLVVAVTGLLFSHMRGLMVAGTIGTYDIYKNARIKSTVTLLKLMPAYLPALLLFGTWMVFHYVSKGWIGYHPNSPWAGCFELADKSGFIKNIGILIWRLIDFGKLFLWLALLPFLDLFMKKKLPVEPVIKSLVFLLIVSILFCAPTMLIYKILNDHRYLIPVYYFLSVLVAYLLFVKMEDLRLKKILTVILFAGLLSGNFWTYPDKIAKGWDATLAHLPYHHLRKKMISYIDDKHIPFERIGSEIPNTYAIEFIELNGDERSFSRADLRQNQYVFYSNVFNMFTDEEIDQLKTNWVVEKEYRCLQVYVRLYRNPEWGMRH